MIEVLDPSYGEDARTFQPAPRIETIAGATVGIISNGKQGTDLFFAALADELKAHGAAHVDIVVKPNYSAPAGDDIIDRARQWQAMVAGIGD